MVSVVAKSKIVGPPPPPSTRKLPMFCCAIAGRSARHYPKATTATPLPTARSKKFVTSRIRIVDPTISHIASDLGAASEARRRLCRQGLLRRIDICPAIGDRRTSPHQNCRGSGWPPTSGADGATTQILSPASVSPSTRRGMSANRDYVGVKQEAATDQPSQTSECRPPVAWGHLVVSCASGMGPGFRQ